MNTTPDGFSGVEPMASIPDWYSELLGSVSRHVSTGRRRAVAAVTQQLVLTYWHIGREILDRQHREGYGTKVIDRLSIDLKRAFPDATGFSARNLKYMRAFAAAWPDLTVVQRSAAQLPWRHHQYLLDKLGDPSTRLWYAQQSLDQGWSRDVLAHHIDTRLHERSGRAISNFADTLPPDQSDLAQQATKDPYLFDFLGTTEIRLERDLERGLIDHVTAFLLELGQGFAFVGRQVPLTLGGDEFYCDLLFYHLRLRCYVVVELKAVPFKPDFVGQIGLYLAAIDDFLAHPTDAPTIGLLLCRSRTRSSPSTHSVATPRPSALRSGQPKSPILCPLSSLIRSPASRSSRPSSPIRKPSPHDARRTPPTRPVDPGGWATLRCPTVD